MTTNIIPISDLRRRTAEVVADVTEKGDVFYVTVHGRPAVVVLGYAAYERLLNPTAPERLLKESSPSPAVNSLHYLASLAQDLGVEDLAEHHDRYLYGADV